MRICYIADGKSIHTRRWLEWFAHQGHQVALLTDSPGEGWEELGVSQSLIGRKETNKLVHYLLCVKDIKKFVSKWKPDILHGHFISGYGYWTELSEFHPYVLTAWGSDIYLTPKQKNISRILTCRALKYADLITADSYNLADAIKELEPSCKKVELIRFGVDTDLFKPEIDKSSRKQMQDGGPGPVFISNRRLEPLYQVDVILKAFIELARNHPSARLIILHSGSQLTQLKELAHQAHLDNSVLFPGEISHSALAGYLAAADFYVSFPNSDSTSASLLEAMACGLPVIASNLPSNQEWIQPGINGWLPAPNSLESLIDSFQVAVTSSTESLDSMGTLNRKVILQRAQFAKEMQKMEVLYHSLQHDLS